MNFMERTNNNDNKKRSDDYHTNYEEEDRKTTTSSSASPQGGGMNMIDPPKLLFSSTTNWPNSSSSTSPSSSTRTTALAPNLYQHYTTRGEIIRGTTSLSQQQQQQQQQQQVDLMDINVPWGSVVGVGEREHMFDKVVTPSDVGKLNRLVIPKQHAEKYFPLDSSTQDKGLLLNFQDVSTSKLWRFRYSYWNSSQSYVMTKGWSRFVKDKKLDPGDIVSFHRDRHKIDHLFIDCTHRPPPPPPQLLQYHHHHLLPFPSNNINNSNNMNLSLHPAAAAAPARYANDSSNFRYMGYYGPPPGGLFLPAHAATPFRGGEIRERERGGDHYYHDPVTRHNPNYRTTGYNNNCYQASRGGNNNYGLSGNYSLNDYYRHIHQQQTRQEEEEGSSSSSGMMRGYWSGGIRELALVDGQQQQQQQEEEEEEEMLLHSVPVLVQAAAETSVHNKRLRLFGVNMDCPILNYDDDNNNVEEDITILPTTIGRHNNIDTNNNNAAVQMPPPSNHPHLVQLRLNNNNHNNHN